MSTLASRYHQKQRLDRFVKLVLWVAIGLGIGFRLLNLDGKLYWHDEAYTSLRVAGYPQAEVRQEVFTGKAIEVAALEEYQRFHPERGIDATVRTLAIDDAQHPPLYYVLARLWVQVFGDSIAAIRSFSAVTGLLVLPLIYYLCQELFASSLVSQMAVALIAVSPFHVLYAQEAREYALWTALIALSSWLLLRALRLGTWLNWAVYALALAMGFYTYLLMVLVAIGQGVYVAAVSPSRSFIKRRLVRSIKAYLLAFLVALLAFSPWLWLVVTTWDKNGANWTSNPIPLTTLFKQWGISLERGFLWTTGDFGFDTVWVYATLPILLMLVAVALFVLCRQTPMRVWWFALTLIGSTALPLALPDLILGGQRSSSSRYLVPCYLGVQLAVAYLLASQLTQKRLWQQQVWTGVMTIVLMGGVVSNAIASSADTSWNKVVSYNNRSIAQIVNQPEQPLLVADGFAINFGNTLALSHLLNPQVKLQLFEGTSFPDPQTIPQVRSEFTPVFLLNVTDEFRRAVEQQLQATSKLVFQDLHLSLWQLR